ncbi:MAG: cation:proton antiporter [bacterium]|nr:cation:proton antiporter [bacterium]
MIRLKFWLSITAILLCGVHTPAQASDGEIGSHSAITLLWLALIILSAKIAGAAVKRFRQPEVLGELFVGILLGNLGLIGFHYLEPMKTDAVIGFLSEFGVMLLLFKIGLESNLREMRAVGLRALMIAIIGVIVPFVLGWKVVGPLVMPGYEAHTYLFLGATLTATSVGITARVFEDLGQISSIAAKLVSGAAVIDDVFGLLFLTVVRSIVTAGSVSLLVVGVIFFKAFLFLAGAILFGMLFAGHISRFFSRLDTGPGMKLCFALSFGLITSYVAGVAGLAPIVGAFAAGLVLDPVDFRSFDSPKICRDIESATQGMSREQRTSLATLVHQANHSHVEDLIQPLAYVFVPVFFVRTSMGVELTTFADPAVMLMALGITLAAFIGKLVAGLAAGKGNRLVVGWGMVPRGEVGLIFITIGQALGVVPDTVFSVVIIMVVLTTLIPPLVLTFLLRQKPQKADSHFSPPKATETEEATTFV